jgi:hypothetical protein
MSWVTEIHKQQNLLADTADGICDLCRALERTGQHTLGEELLWYAKSLVQVSENLSLIINDKLNGDLREVNEAHHKFLHTILTACDK